MKRVVVILLGLAACQSERGLPAGAQGLSGPGAVGLILAEGGGGCGATGARLGLWGEGWGTEGLVPVEAVEEEPGLWWLYFPLQTGLGEGEAALRLQGREARLPLGARPGEFDVVMQTGPPPAEDPEALAAARAASLEAEIAAWLAGEFLLMDGEAIVGDLALRGEEPPLLAVYDPSWLAPAPVEALQGSEGADILLAFPVEPSFEGEPGLLRINVPTRQVVVPVSDSPSELDRRLQLRPGRIAPEQRAARVAAAEQAALAAERERMAPLAQSLARAAARPDGRCRPLAALDADWRLLLVGYDVAIAPGPEGCEVTLEPAPPQHGRRLRAIVGPAGLLLDATPK